MSRRDAELNSALAAAVEPSFNCISIDGDTSTNDTVLLLASGASGVRLSRDLAPAFDAALGEVCRSLARQIVADGEGVSHSVTLDIRGAATAADAKLVARAIAHSLLCKTAWSSADPNWGRLLAAAGYSGAIFDPERARIWIAGQPVFEYGVRAPAFDQAAAHQAMTQPSMPGPPVAQLALPELTSTAATRPPVDARWRRPTVTGAATTRLVVNMAAPTAAVAIPPAPAPVAIAIPRSRLPLDLIPARTAPHWNPAGSVPSVKTASSFIPLLYQAGADLRFLAMEKPRSRSATKWRILGLNQQKFTDAASRMTQRAG